ncbi:neprilysin-2-like isoform X2 [Oppia nitens]|uniref:neprilysin-2-like isoform X2 n=1 Tax=Oppia nitens TaxID=1686743 RepID=UPI0023DCA9B2|nr:neprilysin-2-like isoform X2 [Oppia nitens]
MESSTGMEVNPSANFASALYPENESFWKFRTRFEKLLLLVVIIVFILCSSLIALMIIVISRAFTGKVCLTPGCVRAASDIINLIDESVSPCDNFYKFACGGWIHKTTIPDETGHMSIFEQSRERLDIQLKDLVEKSNESMPAIVTMRNMYKSCMNISAIENYGADPLRDLLKDLGGWPVVTGDKWDNGTFEWIRVTEQIRQLGFRADMFVQFKVIADVLNNTKKVLFLDEATLGLRRQILTLGPNNTVVKVYHQLMVDTAILMGAQNRTRIDEEMWDVVALEAQIAEATHDPAQGEKKQSWYLHLKGFVDVANQSQVLATNQTRMGYDWVRLANSVLQLNETIGHTEVVMVDNLSYMGHVDYIISYVNKHEKRLMANYMLWRVALQALSTGSKEMRDMKDNLHRHLYGITEKIARWKTCLSQLTGSLSMALSSLYIKHYFNSTLKQRSSEMVNYLRAEFDEILDKNDWMDDITKHNAFKKSRAMKAVVGYPHQLANDSLVNDHYKTLNLTDDNFDLNIRRLRSWAQKREYEKLRAVNDPQDWRNFANSANVNAFYWSQANAIVIPAGILRDVFYDNDRPQYINFGTIGYIIGHEITHAFDNVGAQFDEIGNARNWWKNETRSHYNTKAQCMIKQYSNYDLDMGSGMKINGDLTLKENIADNGALKESYNAYEKYADKIGGELKLPGLKYTPKQLFWISAAMNWCSKSSPEMFKTRLDTDTHSPSQARVNVALGNFKEFAQSFDCKPGSYMNPNPKHRCTVW